MHNLCTLASTAWNRIHHLDLYRIRSIDECASLELPAAFAHDVSLIEWSDRIRSHLPADRLELTLIDAPLAATAALTNGRRVARNKGSRVLGIAALGCAWTDGVHGLEMENLLPTWSFHFRAFHLAISGTYLFGMSPLHD